MSVGARPPAMGIANAIGRQIPVNLCGADPYAPGDPVTMVLKHDGAWAIPDVSGYYPSRRWVPMKQWNTWAHASRAIIYLLQRAKKKYRYRVVDVAPGPSPDEPISGMASCRFRDTGGRQMLPIMFKGASASCMPGKNLAFLQVRGPWEVIGRSSASTLELWSEMFVGPSGVLAIKSDTTLPAWMGWGPVRFSVSASGGESPYKLECNGVVLLPDAFGTAHTPWFAKGSFGIAIISVTDSTKRRISGSVPYQVYSGTG